MDPVLGLFALVRPNEIDISVAEKPLCFYLKLGAASCTIKVCSKIQDALLLRIV